MAPSRSNMTDAGSSETAAHDYVGEPETAADMPEQPLSVIDLLLAAVVVEGLVAAIAVGLAWLLEVDLAGQIRGTSAGWLAGLLWTLPMFALFLAAIWSEWRPLVEIRTFLEKSLGPALVRASHFTLLFVALSAGVCEELLFRGVLQQVIGLVWSSLLFGILHAATPTYAAIASLLGMFLGWEMLSTGDLVAPMLTHSLYDWLAFLELRRRYRRRLASISADGR